MALFFVLVVAVVGNVLMGCSGIVLAGGQSQRMGSNKALMRLDGTYLISRVLDALSRICDDLIISANDVHSYESLPARVVTDEMLGRGALGGIHAGLRAMRNERALVVACDMPFLSLSLLRFMLVAAADHDVVVPRVDGNFEPLHAVYGVNCIAPIECLIADGPRRIVTLYDCVRVRELTEDQVRLYGASNSFFNINTPHDWDLARRLIGSQWQRL
jgi:molybdopterin-guanine dinucleotide biosynthesis protein A